MSIPFLGLGFSFFGKDKSASKTTKATTQSFEELEGSVKSLGKTMSKIFSLNRLQTFVQALSLSELQDIAAGMGDVNRAGGNLTTSLEGTIVASHKTAKALGVNMGMSGKQLRQFTGEATSMGIGLNISADQAGKAIFEFGRASDAFKKLGIRNSSDLAKLAEVTGLSVEEFSTTVRRLKDESKLSVDQIDAVVDSFTAFGKDMGNVKGGLESLPKIMGVLSRNSAMLQKGFKGISTEEFALQTASLGRAFFAMTQDAEAASSMMTTLAENTITAREDFAGMFAGVKDDLPDFIRELGISTGDIGQAFDMMQQGPAGIVAGMTEMVVKAKKSGKDIAPLLAFMSSRLEGTLGKDQAAQIVNFMAQADAATVATLRNTKRTTEDLGKLAREGFSTGRTLADQYQLSQDQFVMGFRKIAKAEAVQFVKDTNKEFIKFNKTLKRLSEQGGPMGAFVDKMSEMHQIGVQALIPQTLRPMTTIMGTMVSEMTPALTALGALGFRLKMLVNPLTLTAAAIGGIYFGLKKLKEAGKTPGELFELIKGHTVKFLGKAKEVAIEFGTLAFDFLKGLPWEQIAKEVEAVALKVGKTTLAFVNSLIPRMTKALNEAAAWVASNLPEIAHQAARVAGMVVKAIGEPLFEALKNWPIALRQLTELAKAAVRLNYNIIIGMFEGLKRYLVEEFPEAAKPITAVITAFTFQLNVMKTGAVAMIDSVRAVISGTVAFLSSTLEGAYKVIKSNLGFVYTAFASTFGLIADIGRGVVKVFTDPVEGLKMIWKGFTDFLSNIFGAAQEAIVGTFSGIADIITAPIDGIKAAWSGFADGISDIFSGVSDTARSLWSGVSALWRDEPMPPPLTIEDIDRIKEFIALEGPFNDFFDDMLTRKLELLEKDKAMAKATWAGLESAGMSVLTNVISIGDKVKELQDKNLNDFLAKNPHVKAMLDAQQKAAGTISGITVGAKVKAEAKKITSAVNGIPSKSIIVSDKDLSKLAPTAQKAFGRMGQLMDTFGGKVSLYFEGSKSIAALGEDNFNKLTKAATKWAKDFGMVVSDIFTLLWGNVLRMTDKAIKAVRSDTLSAARELRTLTAMAGGSSGVKIPGVVTTGPDAAIRAAQLKAYRSAGSSIDEDILYSINNPAWYEDFKLRYAQQTQMLSAYLARSMVAGATPAGALPIAGDTAAGSTLSEFASSTVRGRRR